MPEIDQKLVNHYATYYSGGSQWRRLGSVAKVANIGELWRRAGRPFSGRVLDIGCGEGSVSEGLTAIGFDVHGIDLSSSAVEAARLHHGMATYSVFNGMSIPADDDAYDLAVMSHVVEHLEHPRVLLKEAKRVAHRVYIEVPLELTVRTPKHFSWNDTGHINLYNALTIRHLVESIGLKVVDEQYFDHDFGVISFQHSKPKAAAIWTIRRGAYRLSPRIASSFFVYHYGLLAEAQ